MSSSLPPVPLEALLTHRAWVRRLARSLVLDGSSAEDIEQATWIAALRNPPRHAPTARAWLGRVVRNLALDTGRARRRREAHEFQAARPEALRPTSDVVAEADTHARLVAAVHNLAEPYRTTVLLRWFEDLPPATVAGRMGVPLETVRTRLRRAHQMLRDDLGSRTGDATAWIAALVPLTGIRPDFAGACATSGAAPAAAIGGAVMGTKTVVAVAAGVAVGIAFVGGQLVGSAGGGSGGEAGRSEVAALTARLDALEASVGEASRRAAPAGERRNSAIEDRVAAQESRLAELETSLGVVRTGAQGGAKPADEARTAPAGTAAADPNAELKRLEALSNDELLLEMRQLLSLSAAGNKLDAPALVRACDVFLGRGGVEAEFRFEALMDKGVGHRSQMSKAAPEQRAYAESAFRDAMTLAGSGTIEGRSAEAQLAWTAQRAGDHRAAAEIFVNLASDLRDEPVSRAANRLSAAEAFDLAKDTSRATAELQSLIEDFGAVPDASNVVERARAKLDEIGKRASGK
jgi:RNA polymerase sigma factor (sigma-70 family)